MKIGVNSVFLFLLFGCSSLSAPVTPDYLTQIVSLPLGSKEADVEKFLGRTSSIEQEADGLIYTYFVTYKGRTVPKAHVWLNSDLKVVGKHINLFAESADDMKTDKAKRILGLQNLEVQPDSIAYHYIPSDKTLIDSSAGVALRVRKSTDEVYSVNWFQP